MKEHELIINKMRVREEIAIISIHFYNFRILGDLFQLADYCAEFSDVLYRFYGDCLECIDPFGQMLYRHLRDLQYLCSDPEFDESKLDELTVSLVSELLEDLLFQVLSSSDENSGVIIIEL